MDPIKNYIDGALAEPNSGAYLDNYTPATGQVYSQTPDSDESDVDDAVKAAQAAFPVWSKTPKEKRSEILNKIAKLIEQNLDKLALAESTDNGKPVALAKLVDIPRAAQNFKFYATAILHYASESHAMENGVINYTLREPLGVAGCISPWNLPLYLFTWKIAPALAAGNTVVAKPSEVTPMTAFLLSELCIEAGLPAGVLNVVHGLGAKVGAAITAHPDVPMISFTGGTSTGAEIARVASPMFKKLSLELGGKNPNIIFADCDFDKMLKTTIKSSFSNQGEICLCGSRIFIEKPIYEKFREEFINATGKLKVGDPNSEDSDLGAIVSEEHMNKILSCIELAKQEGGNILAGGNQVKLEGDLNGGWYIEPTIVEGLGPDCRTNQEEVFGPFVTLIPFDTEEDAVKMANSTKYGLSATIWTQDLTVAHRVAGNLHVGITWINCWLLRDLRTPFGGIKSSGVGREGGFEALHFFTEPKNVCIKH
ncbi:MAG: aldehyde dehydrogenase [Flavobacteriales bacterium]|nr:aldehyde dehydrogenase [Flavobacteriales bacterium]